MISLESLLSKRVRRSGRKAKMKFLVIILAAAAIGAQCRSTMISDAKDSEKKSAACLHRSARVHRDEEYDAPPSILMESTIASSLNLTNEKTPLDIPEQVQYLIILYKESFAKLIELARRISKSKNKRESDQVGSLVEQLIKIQSKMRNMYAKPDNGTDPIDSQTASNQPIGRSTGNLKDLLDTIKELDIVCQDAEMSNKHVRTKRGVREKILSRLNSEEKEMIDMLDSMRHDMHEIQEHLDKYLSNDIRGFSMLKFIQNPDSDASSNKSDDTTMSSDNESDSVSTSSDNKRVKIKNKM